jgi:hypothetical protein
MVGQFGSCAWLCLVALTGCALPGIHREEPTPDAGMDDEALTQDPAMDPANRNEDHETFISLLPRAHNFAEWPMPDAAADSAVKPNYAIKEQVIIDKVTNLRWQRVLPDKFRGCKARYPLKGVLQAEGTGCTWLEAREYCSQPEVAEALGPGEWRLPTKVELESLLDVTRIDAIDPIFDTHPTDFFWSATPVLNPTGLKLAWAVDFSDGYPYTSGRFKGGRVRCVSSTGETAGGAPDHSFDADVTRDSRTGLMWQRFSDSETRTFNDSREYCQTLDLQGDGWRLPTLKELLTIVDPTRRTPAIIASSFPFTPLARFWSSSKRVDGEDDAYQVDYEIGGVIYTSVADKHYVRCVR